MKVRLLVPRATVDGAQHMGDVIDVSDAEGGRMCAEGQAEEVTPPAKRGKREQATDK